MNYIIDQSLSRKLMGDDEHWFIHGEMKHDTFKCEPIEEDYTNQQLYKGQKMYSGWFSVLDVECCLHENDIIRNQLPDDVRSWIVVQNCKYPISRESLHEVRRLLRVYPVKHPNLILEHIKKCPISVLNVRIKRHVDRVKYLEKHVKTNELYVEKLKTETKLLISEFERYLNTII